MKKNLWLLGFFICILVSCKPTAESGSIGSPKDSWSDITSLEAAHGTWVTLQNRSMPLVDALEIFALFGFDSFDPDMLAGLEPFIKNINVDIAAEMTMIIDADAQTMANAAKTTLKFSGENAMALWIVMQVYIPPENLPPGVSFDDTNYTITADVENPPITITEEDLAWFQINQDGTKLKATTEYAGYEDVIFTRVA